MNDFYQWYNGLQPVERGLWLRDKKAGETWTGFWRRVYAELNENGGECDEDNLAHRTES